MPEALHNSRLQAQTCSSRCPAFGSYAAQSQACLQLSLLQVLSYPGPRGLVEPLSHRTWGSSSAKTTLLTSSSESAPARCCRERKDSSRSRCSWAASSSAARRRAPILSSSSLAAATSSSSLCTLAGRGSRYQCWMAAGCAALPWVPANIPFTQPRQARMYNLHSAAALSFVSRTLGCDAVGLQQCRPPSRGPLPPACAENRAPTCALWHAQDSNRTLHV